jgi:hypothetical protein
MRPTNKHIHQHDASAYVRDKITADDNEIVKKLQAEGAKCLTCNYFPTPATVHDVLLCKNPRSANKKKPVRWYNICAKYSNIKLSEES